MNQSVGVRLIKHPSLAALIVYCLCITGLLWPLWFAIDTRLPIGTEETRTVPLFNLWTMQWNVDRAGALWKDYWDAPIFYPDRNALAYSEPQPLTALLAPLMWWSSPALAYNFYVAVSLLLNGCFAHQLLRWRGFGWISQLAGGLMMITLPIVHWQMGVVQLVPLWGILWTLWALAKLQSQCIEPTARLHVVGLELGTALAVTSWMAIYHALFLTTLLAVCAIGLGSRWLQRNVLTAFLIAALVCLLLVSPMLGPMLAVSKIDEFVRPADMVEKLSLYPQDYLPVFGNSLFGSLYPEADRYWLMNAGWSKTLLACLGLFVGWRAAQGRRWNALLGLLGVSAFTLSMGAHLTLGSWNLWEWLAGVLPGFEQVRSPFRYGYFVQIVIALAAAGGIQSLWLWSSAMTQRSFKLTAQLAVVCTALLCIFDPLPPKLKLCALPDRDAAAPWCDELRRAAQSEPGAALCLPMAGNNEVRDFEKTCEWMLYGLQHRIPLVNGYSGFCPQRVLDLGAALVDQPLNEQQLSQLYQSGVRYLIVERSLFRLPWKPGEAIGDLELELITEHGNIDGYSIKRTTNR